MKKIALVTLLTLLSSAAFARKVQMPVVDTSIGDLPYQTLNFNKGIYKKTSGTDHCIEGEYSMVKIAQTGRVFLSTPQGAFIDHLDQKVKVYGAENGCIDTHYNVINSKNELENTLVQQCKKDSEKGKVPFVSTVRKLKIKFEKESINYEFVTKDLIAKTTYPPTKCELARQPDAKK